MAIFPQPNWCFDPGATRFWLIAGMAGNTVMVVALLVQVGMLWRSMTRVRVVRWWRLPLVLPLVWAGFCAIYVAQAFIYYRGMQAQVPLLGELPVRHGLCLPPTPLGGDAQVALIGAACLLMLGWLALSALARRIRAA